LISRTRSAISKGDWSGWSARSTGFEQRVEGKLTAIETKLDRLHAALYLGRGGWKALTLLAAIASRHGGCCRLGARPYGFSEPGFAMSAPEDALALIRSSEGLSLKAYLCPAGKWTIGYGHTEGALPPAWSLMRRQPRALLAADVAALARSVDELVTVTLTPSQRSALLSFVYNVGCAGLRPLPPAASSSTAAMPPPYPPS
jgi:hypothetical protein